MKLFKFIWMNIQVIIRYIYVLSLGTTLIGAAISTATMSTGQISLASIWLIDMAVNYKRIAERFKSLRDNKAALVCISIFLMYIIGLLWTDNYAFAMRDLRSKLPFLLFPLTIATIKPLNIKELKAVFYMFLAGNLLGTLLVLYAFIFAEVTDIRQIIFFNSNIRFGLTVLMAIVVSFWFFKTTNGKYWFIVLIAWFTGMLFLMESLTALCILPVIIVFFGLRNIWLASNKIVKWGTLILIITMGISISFYIHHIYSDFQPKESKNLSELDKTTKYGCEYQHDTTSKQLENGYWVKIYICETELRESWNKRSTIDFDGKDSKGYDIKMTLIRYLSGKGLRKDAEGIAALSDTDIHNIEHGIANHYNVKKSNIDARIRTTFWEYYEWGNSNYAHKTSLTQRFEFWRAGIYTIKHHFWLGVGTGDMMDAQQIAYKESGSLLSEPEIYKTPHNHYLIVFSTFGIFGFLWFLFALIYPGIKMKKFRSPLYIAFFIVIMLSMIVDKLGVGLFAAFNTLLLFGVLNED